ncbi:MAG: thermonuclease family protein [Oscillospiraceae bacterium]|nr:thermonuclease family protein [Oscillospiraceae bacterium]
MRMLKKLLCLLMALCLAAGVLAGCGEPTNEPAATDPTTVTNPPTENVDYAASLKLDMNSATAKQEVTVKQFIDGDTTHFHVPSSLMPGGVLKARYLAVNTPESTGKIEEYGKKASSFTKEKLTSAVSIVIESDTESWEADSTGDRYLSWIWYKTEENGEYRNLNIELLQNGLAIASNSANNQYGTTCMAAINQAKAQKLNVYSGQKDPDFYYGDAVELTLKELRTNIEQYANMKVAFNGVVTVNDSQSVYVEAYDAETDMYYGMAVYYGYNLNGKGMEILTVGNEVRIVGSVQYYEAGGTWQVSDLNYRLMKPDDPSNIQKISEGNDPAFFATTADRFLNGQVTVTDDEGNETTNKYAAMAMSTSIEMKGLTVVDSYTTKTEGSASKGAFTLTCVVDGQYVDVRTTVLTDKDGNLVKADVYEGKTIDVKGIVDYYNGTYQIKVFSADNITIH